MLPHGLCAHGSLYMMHERKFSDDQEKTSACSYNTDILEDLGRAHAESAVSQYPEQLLLSQYMATEAREGDRRSLT